MKQATCQNQNKTKMILHKEKHTHQAKQNSTQVHMVYGTQARAQFEGRSWDEERNQRSHPSSYISC